MLEIQIEAIDHVSLPVALGAEGSEEEPLNKSRIFYSEILGLKEIGRPESLKKSIKVGVWYQVGDSGRTLHLIANEDGNSTFREGKGLSSRDIHFALRVNNFLNTLQFLVSKGYWLQEYRPQVSNETPEEATQVDLKEMRVSPEGKAGFPQIFIMDPDRNVIELNVGHLLNEEELTQVNKEIEKLKQPQTN